MSSLGSPSPFFLAGKKAYQVERSLRFNSGDSPYLELTPSGAGSNQMTFSFWIKRGNLGSNSVIFSSGAVNARAHIYFDTSDKLSIQPFNSSGTNGYIVTNMLFRDLSAWYHILVTLNNTAYSDMASTINVYVNNVAATFTTYTTGTPTGGNRLNDAQAKRIGEFRPDSGGHFDGYLAEFNFIDGQALTPSSFGETDATTGQWIPKKYVGSYGTNGFYLNFSDNSGTTATTLGKDSSGNSNNWTPNNFSVAAGAGNDSLEDTPTNNFCTLNPLDKMGTVTLSEGNLKVVINGDNASLITGSFGVSSGKWYYEAVADTVGEGFVGWIRKDVSSYTGYPYQQNGSLIFYRGGSLYKDGAGGQSYGSSYVNGDIIGCAINLDDNEVTFYKNNSSQGTVSITAGTYNPNTTTGGGSATYTFNFGQRAFSYTPPTGYKSLCSANLPDPTIKLPNKHFDTLLYTGSNSSSLYNVTGLEFQPDWVWGKSRNDTIGHILFDAVRGEDRQLEANLTDAEVVRGSAAYRFLSNGFAVSTAGNLNNPVNYVAWNWNAGDTDGKTYTVKVVSDSGNKYRFDNFGTSAVTLDLAEGGTYIFNMDDASNATHPFSIGTAANGTVYTSGITYFLDGVSKTYSEYTSGFAAATTRRLHITVPASAPVLYYWCSVHSGMGGQINTNSSLGSSNFDGSILSVAKANTTAGFSIVTYTGTSASTATIGHGLGVTPNVIIVRERDDTSQWAYFQTQLGFGNKLNLDLNSVSGGSSLMNSTAPTSTVFTVKNTSSGDVLNNGGLFIAYCFSEVAGYSKFGSYTGNGSSDGVFVFLGFRAAFIMIKSSSLETDWDIITADIDGYNVVTKYINANQNSAEGTYTYLDILSNGFKARNVGNSFNQSGASYIYMAFAESPFKNARAR